MELVAHPDLSGAAINSASGKRRSGRRPGARRRGIEEIMRVPRGWRAVSASVLRRRLVMRHRRGRRVGLLASAESDQRRGTRMSPQSSRVSSPTCGWWPMARASETPAQRCWRLTRSSAADRMLAKGRKSSMVEGLRSSAAARAVWAARLRGLWSTREGLPPRRMSPRIVRPTPSRPFSDKGRSASPATVASATPSECPWRIT